MTADQKQAIRIRVLEEVLQVPPSEFDDELRGACGFVPQLLETSSSQLRVIWLNESFALEKNGEGYLNYLWEKVSKELEVYQK